MEFDPSPGLGEGIILPWMTQINQQISPQQEFQPFLVYRVWQILDTDMKIYLMSWHDMMKTFAWEYLKMCIKALRYWTTKIVYCLIQWSCTIFDLSNSDHRHLGWNRMMTTRILQLMRGPRQVLLFKWFIDCIVAAKHCHQRKSFVFLAQESKAGDTPAWALRP